MKIFLTSFLSLCYTLLCAQMVSLPEAGVDPPPEATAVRFPSGIELDGRLDEASWYNSQPADKFWETFPSDSALSTLATEIYFGFDDNNLYVGAKCYTSGSDFVISSLKRDYRAGGNDNITLVFNTFNDKTNAIVFGMNPLGVNREALIYNGGESGDDFREEWDNKWRGESYIGEGYWSCELAIPFSSLRFPANQKEWFFNSYRFDTQSNTRSTWHRIPQNQMIMSLAYMGKITFDEAPSSRGSGITLIPYVGGGVVKDYEEGTEADWSSNIGGDAKIAIGSNLNLDLTVNPDFSQVEVDEQVINTTRFELFFPERRQFFLENADLFGSFGFENANPFFSRRIGVTQDTTTGIGIQNPIYAGARLSGRLNENWRVGLLNMQAASNPENGLPSYNYSVAAAQRMVGARSNLGAIVVNKQNFTDFSDSTGTNQDYNRVIGIDYNLATLSNNWNGKAFVHKSLSPDTENEAQTWSHGLNLEYRERNWNFEYNHSYIGEDFDAEVGFVPRRGIFSSSIRGRQISYPNNGRVIQKGPTSRIRAFFTPENGLTDRNGFINYSWQYANTSRFTAGVEYSHVFLLEDFDPTRSDATPLPGNRGYDYTQLFISYSSDNRKKFSFSGESLLGEFFNGRRYSIGGNLIYRYQPYGSINLRVNYQYIDLPAPFASTALFLIGPRIDLTFTKSLFWTTFIQYNDQFDNINLNTRLQWRFAPVSDFFLVYTDNYDSIDFGTKNRAIVAKLTYWLNI